MFENHQFAKRKSEQFKPLQSALQLAGNLQAQWMVIRHWHDSAHLSLLTTGNKK